MNIFLTSIEDYNYCSFFYKKIIKTTCYPVDMKADLIYTLKCRKRFSKNANRLL